MTHATVLRTALPLLLLLGCSGGSSTPTGDAGSDDIVSGLSECDSDDGTYTEVRGRWAYTMDGVDTGRWRLGVSYLEVMGIGQLSTYGCVIEGGTQLYEYSGILSATPGAGAGQTLSPGATSAATGRFQAGLNRNLGGDHDTFIVMGGDPGSGTVTVFEPATGHAAATLSMTARPLAMVEADDLPSPVTIDFDIRWAP